jgi:hypothetical protein
MLAFAIFAAASMVMSPAPQWVKSPTAGIPRTADGKPDLLAPAPKLADGKPDISGIWFPARGYISDIARGLKPGDVPFQPWAEALYKERLANNMKDDPTLNASSAEFRDRMPCRIHSRSFKFQAKS